MSFMNEKRLGDTWEGSGLQAAVLGWCLCGAGAFSSLTFCRKVLILSHLWGDVMLFCLLENWGNQDRERISDFSRG